MATITGPRGDATVEQLARDLVEQYGRHATDQAARIVAGLIAAQAPDQARRWSRVMAACERILAGRRS